MDSFSFFMGILFGALIMCLLAIALLLLAIIKITEQEDWD
jgi:hypothetical protein